MNLTKYSQWLKTFSNQDILDEYTEMVSGAAADLENKDSEKCRQQLPRVEAELLQRLVQINFLPKGI